MSNTVVDFRLYLITDRKLFGSLDEMLEAIEKALQGGVKAVQLREKDLAIRDLLALAYQMRELTAGYGAKLFINDRVDIALAADADGVHLGGWSIPVQAALKASEGKLMIGVSTHSLYEARQAAADGADFMTMGPVYETPSKMQYGRPVGLPVLAEAAENCMIPVFAIGGITAGRIGEVLAQGAYGAALISAVLTADDIQKTTEEFVRKLS
ncbi:MAG: thiamine phosphate synthase [Nitrospirae bacterium]|nr:thiamine phosphate synthase [Nitrospirota bacterium]